MIDHIPDWAAFLVGLAATLTAVSYIWRKWLRPLTRGIHEISEALPTLRVIASEFRKNHGMSLRDTIDRVEANGKATAIAVDLIGTETANRTQLFVDLKSTMEATNDTLAATNDALENHMDDDKALFEAAGQALVQGQQLVLQRLEKIEEVMHVVEHGTQKRSTD